MGFLFKRPAGITIAKSAADALQLDLADAHRLSGVKRTAQDSLNLALVETARQGGVLKLVSDAWNIGIGEVATRIIRRNYLQRVDTLSLALGDQAEVAGPGILGLSSSAYSVHELNTLQFQVLRGNGDINQVRVTWTLTGLSGASPSQTTGTVTFADRDSAPKTVSIAFGQVSGNLTGQITLSNPENLDGGSIPSLGTVSASATVQNDTTAPSTPAISAEVTTSVRLTLAAAAVDAETGIADYILEQAVGAGSTSFTQIDQGSDIFPVTITGLSPNTYRYRAKATNRVGLQSGYSAIVDAVVQAFSFVEPQNYTLSLISPRQAGTAPAEFSGAPSFPTNHPCLVAYPGMQYSYLPMVVGGALPYAFSLSNAPAGMTINSVTGRITWPNPTGTTVTPTITVVDAAGVSRSQPWTITVTTTRFKFVNGDVGVSGTGTINSPYKTMLDVKNGASAGDIIVFRLSSSPYNQNGITQYIQHSPYDNTNINTAASTSRYRVEWRGQGGNPVAFIAYPGETPVIDFGGWVPNASGTGVAQSDNPYLDMQGTETNPVYIDGLEIRNARKTLVTIGGSYASVTRCNLHMVLMGVDGENPGAITTLGGSLATGGNWFQSMQECRVHNMRGAAGFWKIYNCTMPLISRNDFYDSYVGLDPKAYVTRFEHRYNKYRNMLSTGTAFQRQGFHGNFNMNATNNGGSTGETRFNLYLLDPANSYSFAVDLNNFGNSDEIFVVRETIIGSPVVEGAGDGDGPFNFRRCVIVNSNTANVSELYAGADRIMYFNLIGGNLAQGELDVVRTQNLVGGPADGIVDSAGSLQGSYLTQYGPSSSTPRGCLPEQLLT